MNKKLLTLAISAAIAAPMMAQADVKISGQFHLSADYLDSRDYLGTSYEKTWNVSSNSSNFKIEVNEDLGGGFKAIGLLQEYVRMDHTAGANTGGYPDLSTYNYLANTKNTSRLYDGEAYIGLASGFGTVVLGAVDTPAKKNGAAADLFRNQIGDNRNMDVANNRIQNTVAYISPTFVGLTVTLAHSTNLDNSAVGSNENWWGTGTVATTARANAASVVYKGGPLMVGAAIDILVPVGYLMSGVDEEKWTNLAAGFDVGPATIKAFYQQHDNVAMAGTTDKTTMGIGAAVKLGDKHKVKAQFYQIEDDSTNNANDGEASLIALGYDYAFSKTFTGYVAYAQSSNDTNKAYSMAGGGHGDAPNTFAGEDMNGLSFGAMLNF